MNENAYKAQWQVINMGDDRLTEEDLEFINAACAAWRLALQVMEMATVIKNINPVLQNGDIVPHG